MTKHFVPVEFKRLHPDAKLPAYQTEGSAGADVYALVDREHPIAILPGETKLVKTGIAIYVGDHGVMCHVMARSGLALKQALGLGNGVGLLDADYQGELGAILQNRGSETVYIKNGDRVAQVTFLPVFHAQFREVHDFSDVTTRGEGGYGHTGVGAK